MIQENGLPRTVVGGGKMRSLSTGFSGLALLMASGVACAGDGGELQDLGGRFGRFMGSFVHEMGQSAANRDRDAGDGRLGGRGTDWNRDRAHGERYDPRWGEGGYGTGEGRARDVRRYRAPVPMYDPWGANQWGGYWGSPLMEYDPWISSSPYADWDWEMSKGYYGAGAVAPWEHGAPLLPGPDGSWNGNRYGIQNGYGPGYGMDRPWDTLGNRYYGSPYRWDDRAWGGNYP